MITSFTLLLIQKNNQIFFVILSICDALRDLVKPATLLKVTRLHGCFSRFLNCINGAKSRKASHVIACWLFLVIRLFPRPALYLCLSELFQDGGRYPIEASPLICSANQWTGFYVITAFVMKELNIFLANVTRQITNDRNNRS